MIAAMPSADSVKLMMIGPSTPAAAWWMCAMVGVGPEKVKVMPPVISLVPVFTMTAPRPVALLVTGGTSAPPLSVAERMMFVGVGVGVGAGAGSPPPPPPPQEAMIANRTAAAA